MITFKGTEHDKGAEKGKRRCWPGDAEGQVVCVTCASPGWREVWLKKLLMSFVSAMRHGFGTGLMCSRLHFCLHSAH